MFHDLCPRWKNNRTTVIKLFKVHLRIFQNSKSIITVGRNKDCTLHFDKSSSFSRVQFVIQYDENLNKWFVSDGDGKKKSTNGTWLFLNSAFEIKEDLRFRINSSSFKIELF